MIGVGRHCNLNHLHFQYTSRFSFMLVHPFDDDGDFLTGFSFQLFPEGMLLAPPDINKQVESRRLAKNGFKKLFWCIYGVTAFKAWPWVFVHGRQDIENR